MPDDHDAIVQDWKENAARRECTPSKSIRQSGGRPTAMRTVLHAIFPRAGKMGGL